jgi:hypothetical protein
VRRWDAQPRQSRRRKKEFGAHASAISVFVTLAGSGSLVGQVESDKNPRYGFPSESRLESWQEQPNEPDLISHRQAGQSLATG